MKALLITHDFLPDFPGGISTYYYHISRGLGGQVSVLAPAVGDTEEFDRGQPFTIHRRRIRTLNPDAAARWPAPVRWVRAGYTAIAQWSAFYRHARALATAGRVDVLLIGHLHLAPLGPLLRRATGARYGVILHGSEMHRYLPWAPVRRTVVRALNAADFLIVNSEFTRRQYEGLGVNTDQRVLRVNPGVDTSVFRPDAGDPRLIRRRHGLARHPLIVSVARLVEFKGHDTVIRAMPSIVDRVPEAAYLIVGDGPNRADLEALISSLDLEGRVVFAGFVPDRALPAYYRAASVVAVPTREVRAGFPIEGFGIVFIEASACGRPVVGGLGGGTDESIEDGVTGFRVDPNDVEAVADAVVRLLTDRQLARRMGVAARERAVERFDWSVQAEKLATFLDEVAADGG